MDRETELDLLDELLTLKAARTAYLDDQVTLSSVDRYTSAERFDRERSHIFRSLPLIAAHRSELPKPGAFLSRQVAGLPVLLTRDDDGAAHAFLNVCRHRGTRLVGEASGCKRRFACPYHAWTWDNRGELKGIPHEQQGFPGIELDPAGPEVAVRVLETPRLAGEWSRLDAFEGPGYRRVVVEVRKTINLLLHTN